MPIIRQDLTTKEWVIIAEERMRRPHEYKRGVRSPSDLHGKDLSPFCPGHEASAEEVFRIANETGTGWNVRVIANTFFDLSPRGRLD